MRKNYELLAGFLVMFLYLGYVGVAQADTRTSAYRVANKSSSTASADTLKRLPNSSYGDILTSVIVANCGSTNSSFSIFNSSAQSANLISPLRVSSQAVAGGASGSGGCEQQYFFDFAITSAITYSNLGAVPASITILWYDQGDNR